MLIFYNKNQKKNEQYQQVLDIFNDLKSKTCLYSDLKNVNDLAGIGKIESECVLPMDKRHRFVYDTLHYLVDPCAISLDVLTTNLFPERSKNSNLLVYDCSISISKCSYQKDKSVRGGINQFWKILSYETQSSDWDISINQKKVDLKKELFCNNDRVYFMLAGDLKLLKSYMEGG